MKSGPRRLSFAPLLLGAGAALLLPLGAVGSPHPAHAQQALSRAAAPSTSIRGAWHVTYGAPAVVTISSSPGGYAMTAKTRVRLTRTSCFLRAGTILAHFSGSGYSYSGQHGLWYVRNCRFARWTPVTLTLNSNATKLTAVFRQGLPTLVFTRQKTR